MTRGYGGELSGGRRGGLQRVARMYGIFGGTSLCFVARGSLLIMTCYSVPVTNYPPEHRIAEVLSRPNGGQREIS